MASTMVRRALLKITADDGDTELKLDKISAKADELAAKHPDLKVRIETAAASAKLAVLRQELKDTAKQADDTGFSLSALGKKLTDLTSKMKDKGGPSWLGPALVGVGAGGGGILTSLLGVTAGAAAGLGGAAIAGAGALAAFGAVAKPVLSQALTAEQAVQKAQDTYNSSIAAGTKRATAYQTEQKAINMAYAEMSPAQIGLSKQLGAMANSWHNLKAAETPVVAGALQPWLRSVTDLTGKLGPIIGAVSPVIGGLGTQFDTLISSSAFNTFRDFIAGTGSKVVGAAGNALIDLLDGLIVLIPKFTPLITGAANAISGWGDSFARWANSQKAADDITKFMAWFHTNGPAVGGMLKNIGGALKALAPGLGPAGTSEINVISGFFGLIAKLPPGLAKPLATVAGILLTLNKLGVFNVGVKLLFPSAEAAAAGGLSGKAAGMWAKLLPGVRLVGGALVAAVVVDTVLKGTSSGKGKNWLDNPFGQGTYKDPATGMQKGNATALTSWKTFGHDIMHDWDMVWNNTVARTARGFHDVAGWFDKGRHDVSNIFDGIRHDVSLIWDSTWNNTVGRAGRGVGDVAHWMDALRHDIANRFDGVRQDVAHYWDVIWGNTVGRVQRGVGDVARWFGQLPGKILHALGNLGSLLYNAGQNIVEGLINGVTSMFGSVAAAAGNLVSSLGGKVLHVLGIGSPSKVAHYWGEMVAQGLANGISVNSHLPANAAAAMAARVAGGLGGAGSPALAGAGGYGGGHLTFEVVGDSNQVLTTLLKKNIRITGGNAGVLGR